MSGIVLTFPILDGKVEAWRRFCQELCGFRRMPYEASRQRLGITRERLALVETAFGATAVTTLEAPDVAQALGQIIASILPFDIWYRPLRRGSRPGVLFHARRLGRWWRGVGSVQA